MNQVVLPTNPGPAIVHRVTARTPDDIEAQVVALLRAGVPTPAIVEKTGVSAPTVRRFAKKHKLARPVGRPPGDTAPPSDESLAKQAEAVRLHQQGMSPADIAKKIARSKRTVYHYLREAGVALKDG